MIRLIGILTGSALAVAFLIVTLGMPEFEAPQPEAAPQTPSQQQPALPPEPASPPQVAQQTQPEPAAEPELVAETPEVVPDSSPEPVAVIEDAPAPREQQWYAFWSPFRSKMAADGFVTQLQRTTGLDYRVVKLKPGVYEVAFAYADDADIKDKLAQISSATGLDLQGG